MCYNSLFESTYLSFVALHKFQILNSKSINVFVYYSVTLELDIALHQHSNWDLHGANESCVVYLAAAGAPG